MKRKLLPPVVWGSMTYICENPKCQKEFEILLELGVEDDSVISQPSPFVVGCPFCYKGYAHDKTMIVKPLIANRPIEDGELYFAYDNSKRENACGRFRRYTK